MSGTAPLPVMSPAPPAFESALAAAEMRLAAEIAALRDVIASRWPDGGQPFHVVMAERRVASAEHAVWLAGQQARDAAVLATFAEAEARLLEAAPEPPRQRRHARHRAGDRPLMWSVPTGDGAAPGAVIPLAAAVAGLAHKLAASKTAAAAVAALVLGAGVAGTAAVAVHAPGVHAAPAPARIAAAVPGWATSATPIAVAVAVPARRRRDGTDAGKAGRLRAPRPPAPSLSPSSPLPPQGTLSAPFSLAIGPSGTAILVITAGQDGAVSWTAEAGNPAVTLDGLASDSGTLQAGQSAEVVVSIPVADLVTPGSTVISFGAGGPVVAVSWV